MPKKISINYIANWTAGEVITERKQVEVFSMIGNAINENAGDLENIFNKLNDLKVSTRWIGQVEDFSSIEPFILNSQSLPQYQPPNEPLPSVGDTVMVDNNYDDPLFPEELNRGRYMYIYTNIYDKVGTPLGLGWTFYNPFVIPLASALTDGIITNEMFVKISNLPDPTELNPILEKLAEDVEEALTTANSNKQDIVNIDIKIQGMKTDISLLNTNKQNRAINLPKYAANNVEGALNEVRGLVDDMANADDGVIWEPTPGGSRAQWSWLRETLTGTPPVYPFTPDMPAIISLKGSNATFPAVIDQELIPKLLDTIEGKIKFVFQIGPISDGAFTTRPEQTVIFTVNTRISSASSSSNATDTQTVWFPSVTPAGTLMDSVAVSLTFGLVPGVNITNKSGLFTFFATKIDQSNRVVEYKNSFVVGNFTLTLRGVYYDKGAANMTIASNLRKEWDKYVKTNLGFKKKFVDSHPTIKPDGSAFNGFLAGEEYDLGISYLKGASSLMLSQGGTILTEGYDYDEVDSGEEFYNTKVIFLKDIDIDKAGAVSFLAFNVSPAVVQYRFWDAETQYFLGNVVVHNAALHVAKQDNIGKEPTKEGDEFWEPIITQIDLEAIEEKLQQYIDQVLPAEVQAKVETEVDAAWDEKTATDRALAVQGRVLAFDTDAAFTSWFNLIKTQGAYYLVNNVKTLLTDAEIVFNKITAINNPRSWQTLQTVYLPAIARVEIVTATPNEINKVVDDKIESLDTIRYVSEYKHQVLAFETQADFEAFKAETGLTDDNFENVTGNLVTTAGQTQFELGAGLNFEQGSITLDTGQVRLKRASALVFTNRPDNKRLTINYGGENDALQFIADTTTGIEFKGNLPIKILTTSGIDMSSKPLTNLKGPSHPADAATKAYVDGRTDDTVKQETLTVGAVGSFNIPSDKAAHIIAVTTTNGIGLIHTLNALAAGQQSIQGTVYTVTTNSSGLSVQYVAQGTQIIVWYT